MSYYDPKKIEKKWDKKWIAEKVFKANDDSPKPKYYQLETFPYPSAAGLHVGHPKGFTAEDIHARYMRMKGHEVLYTMGWDAFGLPTENFAIKVGKNPKEVALANTDNFRRQVQMFGFSYDWDREIDTSSPEYYKWTQWLFIQLYKKGLAYRAKAKVNWCPTDQTVLANEQVIDGKCERDGTEIEERYMEQWFLRITDYADRLLSDLKGLDWPAPTIKRQEDWIGKSTGTEIDFPLDMDYHYVLLHGFNGSPDKVFFPWLRQEFTRRQISFVTPTLPHADSPTEEEQVNYVLQNFQFNEKTVLFGHSLGAVVALKIIEKLEHPIAGVVLAAGFLDPNFLDGSRPFENTFNWKFDFDKIRKNVGFIRTVSDLNDSTVPVKQGRMIHQNLDGRLEETIAKKPHFSGAEEPAILAALLPLVSVFTTRPDTLFGATYLVLAPEHNGIKAMMPKIENKQDIEQYIEATSHKTDRMRQENAREKTGVEIKGVHAINPATGNKIPIWISDYVLVSYGTGAIMAVPAHDPRDLEFAKKFNLPIKKVIESEAEVWEGAGKLINSGKFNGMDSQTAKWEIAKAVGGRGKEHFKIRDWSVSRQRYWGAPIPMIHCDHCREQGFNDGIIPVPEKDLPVVLPDLTNYRPQGMPPLASSPAFMNVRCPVCGGEAKRDPETLDTFVDSSWYYLRYPDPHNVNAIFDKTKEEHWMPVDLYVIGAEHTVLHLLYSRFITKFLHDEGYFSFTEPFKKLRHQGLIMGTDGQKMSKSKGNVVNPDDVIAEFGADATRLYLMFMGPFNDSTPWDTKGILGVDRFLKRFWSYCNDALDKKKITTAASKPSAKSLLHRTIKKVGDDIEAFKFNTAISSLMILLNQLEGSAMLDKEELGSLIKIAHPFIPHAAQELWSLMGSKTYVDFEPWPAYDPALIIDENVTIVLQVNGKIKDAVSVDAGIKEDAAKEMALKNPKVQAALGGQAPKRIIYVDKKLVNIVI
jgi:leucyl-tRNA synthetase